MATHLLGLDYKDYFFAQESYVSSFFPIRIRGENISTDREEKEPFTSLSREKIGRGSQVFR